MAKDLKSSNCRSRTLTTKLTKFIAATGPVARLQLHSDNCRVAVLLPQTTSLEVSSMIKITTTQTTSLPVILLW